MRKVLIILLILLSGCANNTQTIKKSTIKAPVIKKEKIIKESIDIKKPKPKLKEENSTKFVLWNPLGGREVSSPFGYRKGGFHRGVDIAASFDSYIIAAADGTVSAAGRHKFLSGYGNAVLLSHGGDIFTYYAHMNKVFVKKGQNVEQGQMIGTVGNSGKSTGPHLHFELIIKKRLYDPVPFMVSKPIHYRFKSFVKTVEVGAGLKKLMYILTERR